VFVGALHPRKNVINLFKAFDKFKLTDTQQIKIVIVGERFYWDNETNEVYNNLTFKDDIVFTGRLSQAELRDVLGSALALTYVSLFEGFGIPIVEAMYCGVPVITSNTTSMPEIAGNAALIVDPYSIDDIAEAMLKMSTDAELRQKLIDAGNIKKKDYSWDITAQKLWQLVEKVMAK
jgi:glycosyltransferase involved in cell wall biosynthesis